jgi:predicted nucleotidyltransferase
MNTTNYLVMTNHQKVLSFMAKFSDKEFYEREIARKTGISYGSANKVLNDLYSAHLLMRQQKGKMFFYQLNLKDSIARHFKIINTMVLLRPLILNLRKLTTRVILFGSCATGHDTSDSDIDIFIVSEKKQMTLRIIEKIELGRGFEEIQIQPIIFSHSEVIDSEKNDEEFLSLVREGIILWDKTVEGSEIY